MNPLLLVDYYKTNHQLMYQPGMTKLYSNLTPRKSRMKDVNAVVVFGIQHFILEYLIKKFNKDFFQPRTESLNNPTSNLLKELRIAEYQRHIQVDTKHIEALWNLGYLPIEIKALPEGTLCPIGVPVLTIVNTHPDFAWLTNYLETLMSCMLWQPITSATIAYEYKKLLSNWAIKTTGSADGVQWQGHDFSMRGMSSVESAILSGMGHLTSFTGTDTIPAIYQLEESYSAKGLIGASVPATEHSVMCMGTKDDELGTFKRLLELYPKGILSVVSDTWDLWKVITKILPALKDQILARDGKLVIRPDSGDPVDIICGLVGGSPNYNLSNSSEYKGVIELLWDIFGGTTNSSGFKVLDPHIGAIYGDSITLERADEICKRLADKGFASTNIVLGIGSYTYQYNTRDTFGFAIKATYGEITHTKREEHPKYIESREIFKDPITDDGTKKSKKGLLRVVPCLIKKTDKIELIVEDQQSWEQENTGCLTTVFKDGKLVRKTTLDEIHERLK